MLLLFLCLVCFVAFVCCAFLFWGVCVVFVVDCLCAAFVYVLLLVCVWRVVVLVVLSVCAVFRCCVCVGVLSRLSYVCFVWALLLYVSGLRLFMVCFCCW